MVFIRLNSRKQSFPLLRKNRLDASQMKNYRPVLNLSFLSTPLEIIVHSRLHAFLDGSDWCRRHSPLAGSSTVQRQQRWKCTMICYSLLMKDKCQLVSAWLDGCIRHRRPRSTAAQFEAQIWSSWSCFTAVPLICQVGHFEFYNNNNNNKQEFQNAQLTDDCHKGARSNYTGTVWNKAVFNI